MGYAFVNRSRKRTIYGLLSVEINLGWDEGEVSGKFRHQTSFRRTSRTCQCRLCKVSLTVLAWLVGKCNAEAKPSDHCDSPPVS